MIETLRLWKSDLQNWLNARIYPILRWFCEFGMKRRGFDRLLAQRPATAIPPNYVDLWFLYRLVKRRKPRLILEFGSGCSTVVLCQALWENARDGRAPEGHLVSIDADPFWADAAVRSLPPHLRATGAVTYSPLIETTRDGIPVFRHACVPDVRPDLVYLDGPALTPERKVADDILLMEAKLPAGCLIVVDGRRANVRFLRERLKRPCRARNHRLLRNREIEILA